MNDETRRTNFPGIATHIQKNLVDRFPVYVVTLHMHKPHTVVHQAISITTWILETECLCRSRWKRCYVVTFMDLLAFIYCEGYSAPGVVYVMYERHVFDVHAK